MNLASLVEKLKTLNDYKEFGKGSKKSVYYEVQDVISALEAEEKRRKEAILLLIEVKRLVNIADFDVIPQLKEALALLEEKE